MAALPSWTPALAPNLPGSKGPTFFDASGSGTYDDEMFGAHFSAGNGRVNEHIGLIAVHHVFHPERNHHVKDLAKVIQATQLMTTIPF